MFQSPTVVLGQTKIAANFQGVFKEALVVLEGEAMIQGRVLRKG